MKKRPEGGQTSPDIDVDELQPIILKDKDDLVKYYLALEANSGLILEGEADRQKSATKKADGKYRDQKRRDRREFLFGIKDADGTMVATGHLEIRKKRGQKPYGFLSSLTINEDMRRRGLAKKITDARISLARQSECSHVETTISAANPISLANKLKDGFLIMWLILHDQEDSYIGQFILKKDIDATADKEPAFDIEKKQDVRLSDLTTIKKLIKAGWVGFDIANTGKDYETNPKKWLLSMAPPIEKDADLDKIRSLE